MKRPALAYRRLRTTYPCCGGTALVDALHSVPREVYARRCPKCRRPWLVERTTIREQSFVAMDKLEWSTARDVFGRIASERWTPSLHGPDGMPR